MGTPGERCIRPARCGRVAPGPRPGPPREGRTVSRSWQRAHRHHHAPLPGGVCPAGSVPVHPTLPVLAGGLLHHGQQRPANGCSRCLRDRRCTNDVRLQLLQDCHRVLLKGPVVVHHTHNVACARAEVRPGDQAEERAAALLLWVAHRPCCPKAGARRWQGRGGADSHRSLRHRGRPVGRLRAHCGGRGGRGRPKGGRGGQRWARGWGWTGGRGRVKVSSVSRACPRNGAGGWAAAIVGVSLHHCNRDGRVREADVMEGEQRVADLRHALLQPGW